jgi:ribosome-binding factor A
MSIALIFITVNVFCKMKYFLVLSLVICSLGQAAAQKISLAGKWQVSLGSADGKAHSIQLPGTLDDAGIGEPLNITPTLTIATLAHLQRKVQYVGKAYYRRTFQVPVSWKNTRIELKLERVLWGSTVMIDGKPLPYKQESLTTSHLFDLSGFVTPGKKHEIVICVDNSNLYPGINIYASQYPSKESAEMAHSYTNHTQIKWNGILGDIELVNSPENGVSNIQVTPDIQHQRVFVTYNFRNPAYQNFKISSYVAGSKMLRKWKASPVKSVLRKETFTDTLDIDKNAVLWSEFSPITYKLVSIIDAGGKKDTIYTSFGLRDLMVKDNNILLNGNRIFVRGNLECIIFPLKGYTPMKLVEWRTLFMKAKSYGLNTFRFHSWCPPKAAFEAADMVGFYLQVELPHWNLKVGEDTAAFRFLEDEAYKILAAYGNHPSFLFFSLGNELEGDFGKLNALVAALKVNDRRHLYSTTTFTFQKELTGVPQPQDDYYVTQWTKKGWVRGQGVFNSEPPNFSKDFSASFQDIKVPLISHEIGQYSVYPDLKEIKEYTGNLSPLNFIAVKNDLEKKGMLGLAPAFLKASGKLAALLYKEEIERAMKTNDMDGFQLLQLQDFPGQGTALVGLLNAFWKDKGFITPEWFRSFCSEVTPLLRFEKAVYTNDETFTANVELSNFFKQLNNTSVSWKIVDEKGMDLASGRFNKANYSIGNCIKVGAINYGLDNIKTARKFTVKVLVDGSKYANQWDFWVYPSRLENNQGDVVVTTSLNEATAALDQGRKVLLCPSPDTLKGIDGKFVPVFWSPVHFPDQPGTMGMLVNNKHQALQQFPTDNYSNWQWWDLAVKSKSLNIDTLSDKAVIVRVIDNFVRNQNLSNLFEARYGKGKLVVCSIDIVNGIENRPQARQLRYSLLEYMNGNLFRPSEKISEEQLSSFFK